MEEMRSTDEVFKSSSGSHEAFKSKFASSGKFDKAQLESGADLTSEETQTVEEPGESSTLQLALMGAPAVMHMSSPTHMGSRRSALVATPR